MKSLPEIRRINAHTGAAELQMRDNADCEHGHQRRKCPHCELAEADTRVAALEAALRRLVEARARLQKARTRLDYDYRKEIYDERDAWGEAERLLPKAGEETPGA